MSTPQEWSAAWEAFHTACRNLKQLCDRDGDFLKIDVQFKAGGARKAPVTDDSVSPDYDGAPYCSDCGAKERRFCKCPPRPRND